MKAALITFFVGILALIVQGALARTLPPPWCPDFGWLVVIGIGLRWPTFLPGLMLATVLGYSMDLLSGSLMGQHALLRIITFLAAALAARQLNLSGGLPVSIFVFVMTLVYGIATVMMLSFFVGAAWTGIEVLGAALAHSFANIIAAGPVIRVIERIVERFSDEEVGRRSPLPRGFDRVGLV